MSSFDPPRAVVVSAVETALAEDIGVLGDITTLACVDEDQQATAAFVARADGVLAGTALATETYRQVDDRVELQWAVLRERGFDDDARRRVSESLEAHDASSAGQTLTAAFAWLAFGAPELGQEA